MPDAPRLLAARLLTLGLVLPLAACGSINRGDQLSTDFVTWMRDVDGVADVTAGGTNELPWAGSATGLVTLEADLDEHAVREVLARADAFPDRDEVDVAAVYAADGFTGTFDVPRGEQGRDAVLDAVLAAATLPAAESLTLGPSADADADPDDGCAYVLTVTDDAVGRYDESASALLGPGRPCPTLQVATPDGAVTITAREGEDLTGARAALDAVAATHPVTEAHLTPGSLEVRVDAPRSREVTATASAAAPDVAVVVQFGIVTANDASAAALAVADAAAASGAALEVGAASLVTVDVRDVADALTADAAVRALPQAAEVPVEYRTADDVFTLSTDDGPLADDAPLLTALTAPPLRERIESVHRRSGWLQVMTDDATTVDDARALGATCAHLPVGTELRLVLGDLDGFDLELRPDGPTEPDFHAPDHEDAGAPLVRAFADACRGAR